MILKVSASIVIYNENQNTLQKVIKSFLDIELYKELIIVDNSPSDNLKDFIKTFSNVKYIHSGKNLGFGAGHNLAFRYLTFQSDIHLIVNPDTYFDALQMKEYILWMFEHQDISLSVPHVFYPDDTYQYTIRHIPTPLDLFKRRLNIGGLFDKYINKDEFHHTSFTETSEIPFAHGCFFIFQTKVFQNLQGFDERFFMYMEDLDIFIRAKKYGKTVLNPNYKIYHEYRKGSSTSLKLLYFHIVSAIKFFWKYK